MKIKRFLFMIKKNECQLCSWKGKYTEFHHIIPICDYGEDIDENKIELCPNCHSEAKDREKQFAIEHDLVGVGYTKEKLEDLQVCSGLWVDLVLNERFDKVDIEKMMNLILKYKFDRYDLVAYSMGITKKAVMNNLLNLGENKQS